ncbi:MAG: cytochrome c-type biogenesis protein, partial [Steroidobacteraceae bacterium]
LLALLLALGAAPAAFAVDAFPPLPTPQLQQRYVALTHQFRCLVCEDESLADSPVSTAADMRGVVRGLVLKGDTDQQVRDYMVSRYGEFILFRPPVVWRNAWLWGAPPALMIIGVIVAWRVVRARGRLIDEDDGLTTDETLES